MTILAGRCPTSTRTLSDTRRVVQRMYVTPLERERTVPSGPSVAMRSFRLRHTLERVRFTGAAPEGSSKWIANGDAPPAASKRSGDGLKSIVVPVRTTTTTAGSESRPGISHSLVYPADLACTMPRGVTVAIAGLSTRQVSVAL